MFKSRVVTAACAAVALASCHGGGGRASLPAGQAPAIGVKAVKPAPRLGDGHLKVTGQLRSLHEATLSAPATGTLTKLHVRVGDRVKEGDPLAQLDASNVALGVEQARAARAMAQAGVDAASTELERTKQLRAADGAPAAALDRANAAHRQATAALAQADAAVKVAQEMLRDTTLRAPFDGVITARMKSVGETVAMMPPTPVLSMVDLDHLEVRLPVPESLVGALAAGSLLKGTVSPSGKTFEAKVSAIAAAVDPSSRTVEVLADVTSALAPELRPGSIVEVVLAEAEGTPGLYLPAQSLAGSQAEPSVWVVKGESVESRPVRAERVTPGTVRVLDGLAPDDLVVVDGVGALRAGSRVRVTE